MDQLPAVSDRGSEPPSGSAPKRGRPKGARNKRSGDLARLLTSAKGLTVGQQLAHLGQVTAKDIKLAKAWARTKGYDRLGADPVLLAMSHRAHVLASMNEGWTTQDAWSVIMRARSELLPYVHQKQSSIEAPKVDKRPTMIVDSGQLGALANPSQLIESIEEMTFEDFDVTHQASHTGE